MLKSLVTILVAVACSIVGGAASAWYALGDPIGSSALSIGPWTAFPKFGAPDADPYSKARAARDGVLALGSAEGIAFIATRDRDGAPLRLECNYRLEGLTPNARFWTLYADGSALPPAGATDFRPPALNSRLIVRQPDNSFAIAVSASPSPGNWLAVSGSGPMALVLTIYDASMSADADLSTVAMPLITPNGCGGAEQRTSQFNDRSQNVG